MIERIQSVPRLVPAGAAAMPLQVNSAREAPSEAIRPNPCSWSVGSPPVPEERYASAQRRITEYLPGPHRRFLDPSLASEPVMIGATDRAVSIAIKHNAPQESLTVRPNTSRNHAAGLRTFDHDHTHVSLPRKLFVVEWKRTGRLEYVVISVRVIGGHRTLGVLVRAGRVARDDVFPTGRIAA